MLRQGTTMRKTGPSCARPRRNDGRLGVGSSSTGRDDASPGRDDALLGRDDASLAHADALLGRGDALLGRDDGRAPTRSRRSIFQK
jgi:hypothetical protein